MLQQFTLFKVLQYQGHITRKSAHITTLYWPALGFIRALHETALSPFSTLYLTDKLALLLHSSQFTLSRCIPALTRFGLAPQFALHNIVFHAFAASNHHCQRNPKHLHAVRQLRKDLKFLI